VRKTKIAGTAPYKDVRPLQKFFKRDAGVLLVGWEGADVLQSGLLYGLVGAGVLLVWWNGAGVLRGRGEGGGVQQAEPGWGEASAGEVGANFQAVGAGPEHGQGTIQAGAANF